MADVPNHDRNGQSPFLKYRSNRWPTFFLYQRKVRVLTSSIPDTTSDDLRNSFKVISGIAAAGIFRRHVRSLSANEKGVARFLWGDDVLISNRILLQRHSSSSQVVFCLAGNFRLVKIGHVGIFIILINKFINSIANLLT